MATKKVAPKKKAAAKTSGASELLAQILAAPDDLELRLVYADALIEAGDPRGTFIAQQCALANLDVLDPQYAPLLASTNRIEAAHARTWLAPYANATKLGKTHAEARGGLDAQLNAVFENGFLHRIAIDPSHISKHWPVLRESEPIRGMEILVDSSLDTPYRKLKEPRDLVSLKVSPDDWFTASTVASVLAWGMPKLRELDLSRCDLAPTGCLILANQPTDLGETFEDYVAPPPFVAGQLKKLVLKNCNIHDAGAQTLFAADNLAGLEELDISQNKIADGATLEALKTAPAMKKLKRFTLSGNNALPIEKLAGWDVLPRLEQLALPQSITSASLAALFPKPSKALRELDLRSAKGVAQEPDTIATVAESFTSLDLGGTSIGDAGFGSLLAASSLHTLMHLMANGCGLSDDAIHALVKSKLDRLVTLDVSSNKLTDASLEALASWPGLAHVAHLRISNNKKLSAAGYQSLVDASAFHPAVLDVGKSAPPIVDLLRKHYGDAVLAKG